MNLKPLNRKQVKKLLEQIKEQFGTTFSPDYFYFQSLKDKIHIINRDFEDIYDKNIRLNNIGLYIFSIEKDGLRLSIDGAHLLKPKKNIISITREQLDLWIKGDNLEVSDDGYGYYAVKYGKDFIGCGKLKNNLLINFIPKQRRIVTTK